VFDSWWTFTLIWVPLIVVPDRQLSISLRMELLVDILKSCANECFYSFPNDHQYLLEVLGIL
jgi:hypothetical protein